MSSNLGTLWIVATPLGNPGDLSPRAKEILAQANVVLAEDTRRAGLLFARCGIEAKGFMSFHDHNEAEKLPHIITLLQQGETIALVSDAGTPLLSDPGYRLVRACRDAGVRVSPVPGPSAPVAALSASGLPPQPFTFLGFPPRKRGEQEKFFAPFVTLPMTIIFFERKDRLTETLQVAYTMLGNRETCICRELTKTYEEFIHCTLEDHATVAENLLGEITVIIAPAVHETRTEANRVLACIAQENERGGKPKDIARRVQEQVFGWSSKEVYQLMQDENRP